jgi:Polysaccharide pyruvyl transferase
MKKIGILTYIKEYANHGTNMQSYSTLKAVQKTYPNARVELINYSGWKSPMKPYLSNMTFSTLLKDIVRIYKYNKFFRNDLVLSSDHLISSNLSESLDFIKNQNYDAIYVGADTLLELKRARKNELTAYWLDNSIKTNKFLLAASCNSLIYEDLTNVQKAKIQSTIDDFGLLGVRDEPTLRLLSNFIKPGDNRLKLIPDPTFSFEIDYSYAEKYIKKNRLITDKPIVCLHLVRHTLWAKELADRFRISGYLVASFRPAHYADIILSDLSAFEQAGIYKYFKLVITHRFHDSIFSLKNLTPVIFFPELETDITIFNESKTLTLFKDFKIEMTNYIHNRNSITAKSLFDMHMSATNNFKERESDIRRVLVQNKENYESYLNTTMHMI